MSTCYLYDSPSPPSSSRHQSKFQCPSPPPPSKWDVFQPPSPSRRNNRRELGKDTEWTQDLIGDAHPMDSAISDLREKIHPEKEYSSEANERATRLFSHEKFKSKESRVGGKSRQIIGNLALDMANRSGRGEENIFEGPYRIQTERGRPSLATAGLHKAGKNDLNREKGGLSPPGSRLSTPLAFRNRTLGAAAKSLSLSKGKKREKQGTLPPNRGVSDIISPRKGVKSIIEHEHDTEDLWFRSQSPFSIITSTTSSRASQNTLPGEDVLESGTRKTRPRNCNAQLRASLSSVSPIAPSLRSPSLSPMKRRRWSNEMGLSREMGRDLSLLTERRPSPTLELFAPGRREVVGHNGVVPSPLTPKRRAPQRVESARRRTSIARPGGKRDLPLAGDTRDSRSIYTRLPVSMRSTQEKCGSIGVRSEGFCSHAQLFSPCHAIGETASKATTAVTPGSPPGQAIQGRKKKLKLPPASERSSPFILAKTPRTPKSALGATFKAPSPKREIQPLEPFDLDHFSPDHSIEKAPTPGGHCRYCHEPLPDPLPGRLREALACLPAQGEDFMREHAFCRLHRAFRQVVPEGVEKGYPLSIDFEALPARITRMVPNLMDIVEGKRPSFFKTLAMEAYERVGKAKARQTGELMTRFEVTQPGYYGPRGASVLLSSLVHLLLRTDRLTPSDTAPQTPIEYLQQVMVPETAVMLIMEDQGVGYEEARSIMRESAEFGVCVHDGCEWEEELEEDREG
ncbi:uncharacterized protein VTP21DRAFT_10987 [Calcarisporiella thermophila]|uniref:uncharacterized protein n=1 Tax=Calcarisporiella thermophila TaxID=911321 RepID=UPI0037424B63